METKQQRELRLMQERLQRRDQQSERSWLGYLNSEKTLGA